MTPFKEFRFWWRRTTPGSRGFSAVCAALAVMLLAWIALPTESSSTTSQNVAAGTASDQSGTGTGVGSNGGTGGDTTGAAGSGSAAGPRVGTGGPGSGTGATVPGGTHDTGPGKPNTTAPPTAATCTSPTTLKVGTILINVAGLNSTFGVPSPEDQQKIFEAVFDSVNRTRQAGCVKFEPVYQTYNEFDTASVRAICLNFVAAKVFAAVVGFLPLGTDDCVMQNKIPMFEIQPIGAADIQKYYPYYFSVHESLQVVYRNWAYATKQQGFFSAAKGFKKLGIFYRDCQPDVNSAMLKYLDEVGVKPAQISRFNLGCPGNFASPAAIQQGIFQFQSAGVTTLTIDNDIGDVQNITKQAQIQGFHPQYVLPDNGLVGATGSVQFQPDPSNFDKALAITPDAYWGANTGLAPPAPTKTCDQVLTVHGVPKVLSTSSAYGGVICNTLWMLAAATKNAPTLARDQLAAGLQRAKSVPFSYPFGPNDFSAAGATVSGQFWRPLTWHKTCVCWKVDDPVFRRFS